MILVLSPQHFSLLILVSAGNISLPLLRSNKINRLQNVSPYVSLKGPLLVRSYEISLVSYVPTFTQFFSLLLLINFFFHSLLHPYYIISLPLQHFSLGNIVRMILVLSSQCFSVRTFADL